MFPSQKNSPSVRGTLLLAAALVAAAGCKEAVDTNPNPGGGGEGGGDPIDGLSAEDFYKTYVHPEIDVTCGICHTSNEYCFPQFMEANANSSYDALKGYRGLVTPPDNSNLLYHGAHTGPALTESQEALIVTWLEKEFEGQDPPERNLKTDLAEFGRCMDLADFQDEDVYLIAYQQTDAGPCGSCHKSGEAGTWIGYNAELMWEQNKKLPFIKRMVQPEYDSDNNLSDLIPSNRFSVKVESVGTCGGGHPAALVSDANEQALENYFNLTKARWEAGGCL